MAQFDNLPQRVRAFSRSTQDVAADNIINARFIGEIVQNRSRLNVISALTRNDPLDTFRFRVKNDSPVGLAVTADKPVRIEIVQRNGTVIADSEAKFGTLKDNYDALRGATLRLSSGDYFLRVRRLSGDIINDVNPNYAIQLSASNKFTEDYQTIERPQARASSNLVNTANALNSVASFISSTLSNRRA